MKTLSLAVILLAATTYTQSIHAAVEVVPFRVEESRSIDFGNDNVGRTPAGLKLTLSVKGPEAESSTQYGKLVLDEAVDDQGASLIPTKDSFNKPEKFREFSNQFFRKNRFGNEPPAPPQVEIDLAPSKRSATKIAHLRGTLTLADDGTIQTVELPNLKPGEKKSVPVPKDAGLQITVTPAAGDNSTSIELKISGDEGALVSIKMMDASGKEVSSGESSWSMDGGPEHKSLDLNKPLDPSMKLVAKIAVNRKLIKVPLDLKDISLP